MNSGSGSIKSLTHSRWPAATRALRCDAPPLASPLSSSFYTTHDLSVYKAIES